MGPSPSPLGGPKPKMVFFQWDHRPNIGASSFITLQMEHHVKCLSRTFDVTVISEDSDFGAVCDRYEPDLVLFESGYRTHGSRRVRISNTRANPQVPKIALHNGDPWCDRRAGLLADMEAWGIETVFTIGTAMPGYTPTLAEQTFVWPNFIDPGTFRDYGLEKVVPVMLAGQSYQLYPWRQSVYGALSSHYPTLLTPPFQYESSVARRVLSGESYARALNASWLSACCGTMGHELVRKHLEIPGCACLLVAERTPILEAAGFRDGETCVFADASEVIDKVDALFADEARMRGIIAAGHALVHARHTLDHRPQIREWFELARRLPPGHRIIQPGPFAPLEIAPNDAARGHGHMSATGLDRIALTRGNDHLAQGRVAEARAAFSAALDFVSYSPEGLLGLARCDLAEGEADAALERLAKLIETTVISYGAPEPDPVEWALYLTALYAAGLRREAQELRDRHIGRDHPELVFIRQRLGAQLGPVDAAGSRAGRARSVHAVPPRTEADWALWFDETVQRCRQVASARSRAAGRTRGSRWLRLVDRGLAALGAEGIRPAVPPAAGFRYLTHLRDALGRRFVQAERRKLLRQIANAVQGRAGATTPRR